MLEYTRALTIKLINIITFRASNYTVTTKHLELPKMGTRQPSNTWNGFIQFTVPIALDLDLK